MNNSIWYPNKVMTSLEEMAAIFNETRMKFVGEITASRLSRMMMCSLMFHNDFQGSKHIAQLRTLMFRESDFELILGQCSKCGLSVDDNFFPVMQKMRVEDFSTCSICGNREQL